MQNKKKRLIKALLIMSICGILVVSVLCFLYQKRHYNVFEEAKYLEVQNLIETGNEVVVYYGSENCSACIDFAPILKDIMNEANIIVYYINADNSNNKRFADLHGLEKTPTLVIFKDGNEKGRYTDDLVYDGMAEIYNEKMGTAE